MPPSPKLEKAKLVKMSSGGALSPAGIGSAIGSAAAGAAGAGGLVPVVWNDSEKHFRFNPTQLTLNKSAVFAGSNNRESEAGGDEQYSRTGTRTLSFTLYLDEWESPSGDLRKMVDQLHDWCNPEKGSQPASPPKVALVWGKFIFAGMLESANATFDLFRADGTPARGEVAITIKERPQETSAQNPTSGGPAGRQSHEMRLGDSLASVAEAVLGDAGLWRVLAEMNGIDDPTAVVPGQTVLIPSKHDAMNARRLRRVS